MMLLFCLIIPYVLTFHGYRKSQVLCHYGNNIYRNVSVQSIVHCAVICNADFGLCSRFIYRGKQCMLHTDNPSVLSTVMFTTDDLSLFFTKHKACDLRGYDYDVSSSTCLKFNHIQLNWYDARQKCIDEGGDLITVETDEKLTFLKSSLNNCSTSQFYWIGLINGTWTSGESFQYIYGVEPSDIRIAARFPDRWCGRLRFAPGTDNLMYDGNCFFLREFVCELNISI